MPIRRSRSRSRSRSKGLKRGSGKSAKVSVNVQAYCLRCKGHHVMKNAQTVTLKNKRKAMKGVCIECAGKMMKFV